MMGYDKERDIYEAEDIILRKAKESDLQTIWNNVWKDEEIAKFMLWIPTKTEEEAVMRMKRTINYQSKVPAYFVCLKETDEAIGFAGIKEEAPGVYEDCGICVASKYQRRGFGKQIVNALTDMAFNFFNANEFIYGCFTENKPSAALAKSLGFTYKESKDEVREHDGYKYVADYYHKLRV